MKLHGPFRKLAAQRGIAPPIYKRHIDALEAAVLLDEINNLGDQTLQLKARLKLPSQTAEELLEVLLNTFADPLGSSKSIDTVVSKLKEFES